jgi:hypothetical protein
MRQLQLMEGSHDTLPEILIRSQEITILIENRKSHSVRVRLEDLVPSPQHVTIHVVRNTVLPAE